jgi:hypothetical protein
VIILYTLQRTADVITLSVAVLNTPICAALQRLLFFNAFVYSPPDYCDRQDRLIVSCFTSAF